MSNTTTLSETAAVSIPQPTIGYIPIVVVCNPDDPKPGEKISVTVELNVAPTSDLNVSFSTSPAGVFSTPPSLTVTAGTRFAQGTGTISSGYTGNSASLTAATSDGSTSVGIAVIQAGRT